MSRSPIALLPLLALVAATPALAGEIQSGEWEQTLTVVAEGAPPGHGPMKQTMRTCITSREAAIFSDRERWAQEMMNANPQAGCKLGETKQKGNAVTAVLTCPEDLTLTVTQDFSGTTGVIEAQSSVGGVVQSRNRIESRRVADTCSPETIERWKQQNPGKTFAP